MSSGFDASEVTAQNCSQVFIRNLPPNYLDPEIEELCGEYGPIKRIDVIKSAEDGKKVNKGYAFVRFALESDAVKAVNELNGKLILGKKLRAEIALKKGAKRTANQINSASKSKPVKSTEIQAENQVEKRIFPEIFRTVLIFGVAPDLTKNALRKRVRKIVDIAQLSIEECNVSENILSRGSIGRVVCEDNQGPTKLIEKLDGHTIHDYTVQVRRVTEVTKSDNIKVLKSHRLIVRNLLWTTTEKDMETAFIKFGPLKEVHIPKVEVSFNRINRKTNSEEMVTKEKSRGFGFVQFLCKRDADKVVREFGTMELCGRNVTIGYAISKTNFEKNKDKNTSNNTESNDVTDNTQQNSDSNGDSKIDYDSNADSEIGSDDHVDSTQDLDSNASSSHEDNVEYSDDSDVEENKGNDHTKLKEKPKTDVQFGQTVFVRNIPFDADEASIRECFEKFGRVRLALIVKDKLTGLPKGTAFVKFDNKYGAEKCLASVEGMDDDEDGTNALTGGSNILLNGRALYVMKAMDKEEANKVGPKTDKQKTLKKDRRNIYLANEGLLIGTEEAAKETPQGDMDKRAAARAMKKQKLKNPLFFISPLRLSVRNLNKNMTDLSLKKLFLEAAKIGIERKKATVKDLRRLLEAAGEDNHAISTEKLKIPPVSQISIEKARIIRNSDKPDAGKSSSISNELPSRGYGFVDFKNHAHALAALRILNNNPLYAGSAHSGGLNKGEKPRLIVEFAVENHSKIKLQEGRKIKQETRKQELERLGLKQDGTPLISGTNQETKKLSRGQRQREKKRLLKEELEKNPPLHTEIDEVPSLHIETVASGSIGRGKKRFKNVEPLEEMDVDPELTRMLKTSNSVKNFTKNPKKRSSFNDRIGLSKNEEKTYEIEHGYRTKKMKMGLEHDVLNIPPVKNVEHRWYE